ncbi:MAG: ABC transporter permease subunit [Lachnospiraceae bacterium]|nr:ABC transporter permease subunit [Lachnospiraceae bacterium]
MSRLLSAGFTKLFKSSVFYVCMAFMAGFPAFVTLVRYTDHLRYPDYFVEPLDGFLNAGLQLIGIVIAVLASLFIGREHSDGAIRNKLIIGHTRVSIYLSNLIVCMAGSFILQGIYLLTTYALSRTFFGPFSITNADIVKMQLLGLCVTAAYSAIFTLIAMLIHQRSAASVTALIIAMVIFIIGMTVYQGLASEKFTNSPEDSESVDIAVSKDNEIIADENEYPEKSLTGTKRSIYLFLNDYLPSCQADQLAECRVPEHAVRFIAYDLATIIVTAILGILIFQHQDLK